MRLRKYLDENFPKPPFFRCLRVLRSLEKNRLRISDQGVCYLVRFTVNGARPSLGRNTPVPKIPRTDDIAAGAVTRQGFMTTDSYKSVGAVSQLTDFSGQVNSRSLLMASRLVDMSQASEASSISPLRPREAPSTKIKIVARIQ